MGRFGEGGLGPVGGVAWELAGDALKMTSREK